MWCMVWYSIVSNNYDAEWKMGNTTIISKTSREGSSTTCSLGETSCCWMAISFCRIKHVNFRGIKFYSRFTQHEQSDCQWVECRFRFWRDQLLVAIPIFGKYTVQILTHYFFFFYFSTVFFLFFFFFTKKVSFVDGFDCSSCKTAKTNMLRLSASLGQLATVAVVNCAKDEESRELCYTNQSLPR